MEATRIVVRQAGGLEVLEVERFDPPRPGPGEVLIAQTAVGLNFIDTYQRSGLYPVELPFTPGSEAAGRVAAVGAGVSGFAEGDRVGYFQGPPGAYASHRVVAADRLVHLPDAVPEQDAAALLLKGCTVEMLAERVATVRAGDWVLVHAAAGGVGSLLVPWLTHAGARVIAHAGTAEKAARAAASGAEIALHDPLDHLAERVRDATDGAGVRVVFDGVGAASWGASIASVARRGLLVSYGNASGPVPPFTPLDLMRAGSIFVTRPTLADYAATPDERAHATQRVFAMVDAGIIGARVERRLPLVEAADAHRALEARETTGATILIP